MRPHTVDNGYTRLISVRLPCWLADKLDEAAAADHMQRSQMFIKCVDYALKDREISLALHEYRTRKGGERSNK